MSGSVVASAASLTMAQAAPAGVAGSPSAPEELEPDGAGSRWQRARLVLDQHQWGVDAGPVGQVLPVHAGLAHLLPHRGLRRGSTVVVRGSTTVLLALLAEATAEGSWAAVVGMPDLGLLAAAELGVAVSRLALVPRPGAEFGAVVAALLDGLDLVAVAATGSLTTEDNSGMRARSLSTLARRLSARARHRESVLVSFGPWPGADLELDCANSSWSGLGDGHGHLVERELTITVRGRGVASRPVSDRVLLPARKPTPTTISSAGRSRLANTSRQPKPAAPSGAPCSTVRPANSSDSPTRHDSPQPINVPEQAGSPGPSRWSSEVPVASAPRPTGPANPSGPAGSLRPAESAEQARSTHLSAVPALPDSSSESDVLDGDLSREGAHRELHAVEAG